MKAPDLVAYEVWEDSECDSICHQMTTSANAAKHLKNGILSPSSRLIDIIQAATWEEANAIWNLRRGFEPYHPGGESEECPNKCGQWYWPMGSGWCPRCGNMN